MGLINLTGFPFFVFILLKLTQFELLSYLKIIFNLTLFRCVVGEDSVHILLTRF